MGTAQQNPPGAWWEQLEPAGSVGNCRRADRGVGCKQLDGRTRNWLTRAVVDDHASDLLRGRCRRQQNGENQTADERAHVLATVCCDPRQCHCDDLCAASVASRLTQPIRCPDFYLVLE